MDRSIKYTGKIADEVMKKGTIRKSLILSKSKSKKNMAHLLYMNLFRGDWGTGQVAKKSWRF